MAAVRFGAHQGYGRVVFAAGARAGYSTAPAADGLVITIKDGLPLSEARLARIKLPQLDSLTLSGPAGEQRLDLRFKPGVIAKSFRTLDGFGIDLTETLTPHAAPKLAENVSTPPKNPASATVVETGAAAAPLPASLPPEPAPVEAQGVAASLVESPLLVPVTTVSMVTPPPALPGLPAIEITAPASQGLALFQRNDQLFIGVSGREPNELAAMVGPAIAAGGQAQLVPAEGGGRIAMVKLPAFAVYPVASQTPTGWRIDFSGVASLPGPPFEIARQPDFALGSRMLVKAENAGAPISFRDPVVGDTLTLAPVTTANAGVASPFRTPQVEIMASLQGVVVRSLSDNLAIVSTAAGVEVNAPGGLRLAEAGPVARAPTLAAAPLDLPPLFEFDQWARLRTTNFTRERQRLQEAIATAAPATRNVPRIDLARFYFMRGMPVEAASVWRIVGDDQPELAGRPEYHLMDAIGQLSSGNLTAAGSALNAVSQPTADAALWRGLLAARQRDWATAASQYRQALGRLQEYPEPYYSRLATSAIESFNQQGDNGMAGELLSLLTTRQQAGPAGVLPGTEYLAGLLAGDGETARRHFGAAAAAWQQYWRVRADLALVEADLRDKKIPLDEAVRRYERLRFAWRGDALEFDIVQRLAHLHIENMKYAEGFEDYALLTRKFPNDPRLPGLAEEQKVAFRDLFLGPPATKVPARIQLAVWDRYPALRPVDETGRIAMERALAERAASIDLLDQASALLTDVLATVREPIEQARLGARIAGLKLLDGHFEAALAALNQTDPLGADGPDTAAVPDDLSTERRYLRAQTLSGLDQVEPALALLAQDASEPARRLKVDITWRAKRWSEAADAIQPFIGKPGADGQLTDPQRSLIVRRATALALAGDTGGLSAMRVQYASGMDQTVDGPTFQLLTRPDGDSALADAATLGKRVAEVDLFSDFLSRYRSGSDKAATPPPVSAN